MAARSEAEIRAELAEVELENAKLRLEQTREETAQWKAGRAQRRRLNEQRQGQFKVDLRERQEKIRRCTHRQGGSPGAETRGKGSSALRGVVMPQDERRMIMCANCPLRVWEPRRADAGTRLRKGETEAQRDKRVAKYERDLEEFERLWEQSQDQLTPEAGRPMHCGKTFNFTDADGNLAHVPHPCDGYAQGLDNRVAAA
jgi:hypothetical protein